MNQIEVMDWFELQLEECCQCKASHTIPEDWGNMREIPQPLILDTKNRPKVNCYPLQFNFKKSTRKSESGNLASRRKMRWTSENSRDLVALASRELLCWKYKRTFQPSWYGQLDLRRYFSFPSFSTKLQRRNRIGIETWNLMKDANHAIYALTW